MHRNTSNITSDQRILHWFGLTSASVLFVAGRLKASHLFSVMFHFQVVDSWLSMFVCLLEIGLAVFLFNQNHSRTVWLVAAAVFGVFLIVSSVAAFAGSQTCDCFGAVLAKPYYVALLDCVLFFGALFCYFSCDASDKRPGENKANAFRAILVIAATLAILAAREMGAGNVIGAAPLVATLGTEELQENGWVRATMDLANRSGSPVNVIGLRGNCSVKVGTPGSMPMEFNDEIATVSVFFKPPANAKLGVVPVRVLYQRDSVIGEYVFKFKVNVAAQKGSV